MTRTRREYLPVEPLGKIGPEHLGFIEMLASIAADEFFERLDQKRNRKRLLQERIEGYAKEPPPPD